MRAPGYVTDESFVTVTLSYRADPEKDSIEWLMRQAAKMPDDRALRREFLLDWTSVEGKPFYPAFTSRPERYVSKDIRFDPALPVYRGFDFGFRHPACVWMQIRPSGRVVVLHDLLPSDIDTYSFRDLVLFLSGETLRPGTDYNLERELDFLSKRDRALEMALQIAEHKPWWLPAGGEPLYSVPFFPPGTHFINLSGPEAYKISATVESNKRERTDAEVFESGGIPLEAAYQSIEAGETLIRKVLHIADDGLPGLLCSPAAVNSINALGGGIVYAKATTANPRPEKSHKDGLFEHVHDAIRYAITHMDVPDAPLPSEDQIQTVRESSELERIVREYANRSAGIEDDGPHEAEEDIWNDLDSWYD